MYRIDRDGLAPARAASAPALPWIEVATGAPYFVTERGEPWTPVGHNDAINWAELNGLFRRRDLAGAERHLLWLKEHGVTVLRLMLEYAQVKHRYVERPMGVFVPNMVRLWDDLFGLCERIGLRILLTPFDTFWTWLHWRDHPYNAANGGPLKHPSGLLTCRATRAAVKARLAFAAERWGGSGALFAWDLWNEIHPAQGGDSADCWPEFIHDLSVHVRAVERRAHGRAHPQTVSLFGPELWWRPHMPLKEPIFRHPDLDFATIHIYREGTIDHPRDTVAPAIDMGRIVRDCLREITDGRPFLDTEHGPIHTYKDKKRTLPEAFDDEYFRHLQWAHMASGGAGGGMRWPNRTPHSLTPGMRLAQRALAGFTPLIDWPRFRRRNLNQEAALLAGPATVFACGDAEQALVYLLRTDSLGRNGMLDRGAPPITAILRIPGLAPGAYRATPFDPVEGRALQPVDAQAGPDGLTLTTPPFVGDLALAVRRV